MTSSAALVSFMLMMLVIVSTGTAWFVALHPRFIWRIMHGSGFAGDPSTDDTLTIRLGGMLFGAAGMVLLFMADLFP